MLFNITQKQCNTCGEWKDRSEFHKSRNKAGVMPCCKVCHRARVYQWRKDNPEKVVIIRRKHYENHSDEICAHARKMAPLYRAKNLETIREKDRARNQKRQTENPEHWREVKRISRAKNYLKNLPKLIAKSRNRAALKKSAVGKITAAEWRELCNKYDNKCLCCGRSDIKLTLDHIVPLARGGTNTIDNAQPLCRLCNSIKGAKEIDYR